MNVRRRAILLSAALAATAAQGPFGLPMAHGEALVDQGVATLAAGIPAAAIPLFKQAQQEAKDAPGRETAAAWLGRALLEANRPDDAIEAVREINTLQADRVRGLSYAAKGIWGRALPLLEQSRDVPTALPGDKRAILAAHAEALNALGRTPEAIELLSGINDDAILLLQRAELQLMADELPRCTADLALARGLAAKTPYVSLYTRYLEGRIAMASGDYATAINAFEDLLREKLPDLIATNTVIALSEARQASGGPDSADDVLEDFISKRPETRFLDRVFARLNAIYDAQEDPTDTALNRWAKDDPSPRTALAQYYGALAVLREKKPEKALKRLSAFVEAFPTHPFASRAHLLQAQLLAKESKLADALNECEQAMRTALDPAMLAAGELEAGLIHFQQKEYLLAVNLFRSVAQHSPELSEQATYNSALAWLYQGNPEKFKEESDNLAAKGKDPSLRYTLELEAGLFQARNQDPAAVRSLRDFLKIHSNHPRANEARVALAELALLQPDSIPGDRSVYIKAAAEIPATAHAGDRAKLVELFAAQQPTEIIALGRKFLTDFPESTDRDKVRMKIAEALFRNEDYANAQTEFELVSVRDPDSPLVEGALFLAGESAVRTLNAENLARALELFDDVAKKNGTLRLAARQRQASIQARLGHQDEAIIIYDNVLAANPEQEIREEALLGKGDACFAMGQADPKNFERALAVYKELGALPDASPSVRNQALFKQSLCLAKLGRDEDAMAPLFAVVDQQLAPGQPAEYFWFYKAGFEAAQKLEGKQDWRSAAGLYQRIASLDGPRATEARDRANRIRLEHFLWEE